MSEQIKPCPFCTEKYVTIATAAGGAKFITCVDCGADGSAATTEAEAIALWNAAPRPEPARTCATCEHFRPDTALMEYDGWCAATGPVDKTFRDFGCKYYQQEPANG